MVATSLQQVALGTINDKFRRAAPPAFGALGNFVTGLRAYGFHEEATFERSQIDQYLAVRKTFTMSSGAGRLLRFRRGGPVARAVFRPAVRHVAVHRPAARHFAVHRRAIVHRPIVRHSPVFARLFAHRVVHRHVVAAPVDPFGGAAATFQPWNGITALKFGTSYSNIALDSALHFPGTSWVKATGIVAVRNANTITAKVAYGWAVGSGRQLTTQTKVRKCKKRLFRKKCWDEWITIPRGVDANELQSVSNGMNHILFNKIADVAGGRLLRMRYKPFGPNNSKNPDINKHVLTGVKGNDLLAAIHALSGKRLRAHEHKIISGRKVTFEGHTVQAVPENKSDYFTLFVEAN